MYRLFFALAALYGFLATAIGAFAAHALRGELPEPSLRLIDTAVRYQFWHALALLVLALLLRQLGTSRTGQGAGIFFALGTLLFCGSLYTLGLSELRHVGPLPIGLLTPLGGVCLLAGWLLLGLAGWRSR
ncbi:MAG: DUF423 domain-containing protein [Pseudomonadales bacterium]